MREPHPHPTTSTTAGARPVPTALPSAGVTSRWRAAGGSGGRRPTIGWFVHDRPGPIARAHAIIPRLQAEVTVFHRGSPMSLDDVAEVQLAAPTSSAVPIGDPGSAPVLGPDLALELSRWAIDHQPDMIVVDGPLEVAMLARCTGLPIVPVRRPEVSGGPILGAVYDVAAAWIAPFPAALESAATPPEVRQRTVYAGLLSRYEGRGMGRRAARRRIGVPEDGRHATILVGADGPHPPAALLEQASATASAWTFSVLGSCIGTPASSDRLKPTGWTDDVFPHLRAADVVIASTSLSNVADVAAAGVPLALVPSTLPGSHEFACAMEELGAAIVLDDWPGAISWPALLADLLDRSSKPLRALTDGRTAKRAARWIDAWAVGPPADPSQQRAAAQVDSEVVELAEARDRGDAHVPPIAAGAEP